MNGGIRVLCCSLLVCTSACDPVKRINDNGRELVNAAGLSQQDTLKLLQAGADVNARSYSHFGWTPLISAIYHHRADIVDLLLAHGADPNIGDHDNKTALYWAIETWGENTNLVSKLIQQGGDPKTKTRTGSDAFEAAKAQPNSSLLLEIIERSKK